VDRRRRFRIQSRHLVGHGDSTSTATATATSSPRPFRRRLRQPQRVVRRATWPARARLRVFI
jgi:hypothetical protein